MIATVVALLPTELINVYVGSTIRSMEDVLNDEGTALTGYIVFSVQVGIHLLLSTILPTPPTPQGQTSRIATASL